MDRLTKITKDNSSHIQEVCELVNELEICELERTRAKDRFVKLLESAPDAMILINKNGQIVMANGQAEEIFKYGKEELSGLEVEILIPERYRDKHREYRNEYFKSPHIRNMGSGLDTYGLTKDKREFPIDIAISTLETEEGIFGLGAIRDITKQKQAEERIERNYRIQSAINAILRISLEPISMEDQLAHIFDLIVSIPLLDLQHKGCIFIKEDKPDELAMKVNRGLSPSQQTTCNKIPDTKCCFGGSKPSTEIQFIRYDDCQDIIYRDGSTHFGYFYVPMLSEDILLGVMILYVNKGHKREHEHKEFLEIVANTLTGIIKHKRAEQEKQQLREQIMLSEKLLALGRISANVAHEIRNPLTAVGGFARRLSKNVLEGTREKEYTNIIISEVNRLERILKDVLSFSKETHLRPARCKINEVTDESLKMHEDICLKSRIKTVRRYSDNYSVSIDRDRVREVIDNLISNAIDSMPDGGDLTVSVDNEIYKGKSHIVVKIADTGEGISEDDLNMIFEPFFTTKAAGAGHGTGLGLPISRKIMEEHGGFMTAESEKNKSTTFSLYFPYEKKFSPTD